MKIDRYNQLPESARIIREQVFVKEQGFQDEFDAIDAKATHIVISTKTNQPVATCRVFQDEQGNYILGRLAVMKEFRGKNIGATMIGEAESYVVSQKGQSLSLHAQCRVKEFYQKIGYTEYGEIEDDEGCPHIWMRKML